jgi:hypothetical protein
MPFAWRMTSSHPRLRACAILVGTLLGCPSQPTSEDRPASRSDAELARRAHREAFARARALAEAALARADPLAAWACCEHDLSAPHLAPSTLTRAREDARKARREMKDIDPGHLDAPDAVVLRTLDFALRRVERRSHARPPSRVTPGTVVEGLERFVEAVELDVASGRAGPMVHPIESIIGEVDAAGHDLGAASMPALKAACDDLEALGHRLDAVAGAAPELTDPATAAADRIRALAAQWTRARTALPSARTVTWGARIAPGGDTAALARLPDRMGREALVALLRDEEASAEPLSRAAQQLGEVLARLRAMEAKLDATEAQTAEVVSIERCEQAWSRVRAWAEGSTLSPPDPPSCTVVAGLLDGRSLTDAELLLEVVRRAWIEPWATKHRRDTGSAVALVEGRIAAISHRHAASIAAAGGLEDPAAMRIAIGRARDAACLAATALWIHAELDDDDRLRALLAKDCDGRPADAWIADVLARPHRSLQGLGLAFIARGPAAVTALERYAWAPLGLVPLLADPSILQAPATPLHFEIEELQPD